MCPGSNSSARINNKQAGSINLQARGLCLYHNRNGSSSNNDNNTKKGHKKDCSNMPSKCK